MGLSDLQLAYLKAQLISEREQLLSCGPDTLHSDLDRVDIKTEHASNSDESPRAGSIEKDIALEEHLMEGVAQVDLALARIASKDYGVCIDCDKNIPYQRLRAFPAAARCIECKSDFEHAF